MALLSHLPRVLPDPSTATSQPQHRTIVAVHGTLSEPWVFRHLGAELRRRGVALDAPALPHRAAGSIDGTAAAVAEAVGSAARRSDRVDIVGHSLGALVALRALARLYLADPSALSGVGTLVGVGAAWRGTSHRAWYRPDWAVSRLLGGAFVELEDAPRQPPSIPGVTVVSVYSPEDRVVPAWSATLGRSIALRGVSHGGLLRRTDAILAALDM